MLEICSPILTQFFFIIVRLLSYVKILVSFFYIFRVINACIFAQCLGHKHPCHNHLRLRNWEVFGTYQLFLYAVMMSLLIIDQRVNHWTLRADEEECCLRFFSQMRTFNELWDVSLHKLVFVALVMCHISILYEDKLALSPLYHVGLLFVDPCLLISMMCAHFTDWLLMKSSLVLH